MLLVYYYIGLSYEINNCTSYGRAASLLLYREMGDRIAAEGTSEYGLLSSNLF